MKNTLFKGYSFSQLTLGTVQLGMPYGISNQTGAPSPEESIRMLQCAVEGGVNTFDTARGYGNAEQVLAQYLEVAAVSPVVVSKFRISAGDLEGAWNEAESSVRESLRVLNLPKLPVCLLHKGPGPMEVPMKVVPEVLRRLKQEGLIDIGGISAFYPEDVDFFLDEEEVEATQIPMSVMDQRLIRNGQLTGLRQRNKLVFVRSVFLQGLFFMEEEALKGNLAAAAPYLRQLRNLASEAGMSVAQLAFSFIRDLPAVSSIVIGAVNTEQVAGNIALLNGPAVPEHIREGLHEAFSAVDRVVLTPVMWNQQI